MIGERVDALRSCMRDEGVQAYLIPSADPHRSEYPAELWKRRQYISGFTGSAGDAVITETKAGLWTDSRYHLQAGRELDASVYALFRTGLPGVPSKEDWLAGVLSPGGRVGVDPRLLSHRDYRKIERKLEEKGIALCSLEENLVDRIWEDQPARPNAVVRMYEPVFAGESLESKLSRLREEMAREGADTLVVTLLDAVAWLFNLRGADVAFTPVTVAFAIVEREAAAVFVDEEKVSHEVREFLEAGGVEIRPYDAFAGGLAALGSASRKTWIDPASASQWIVERLGKGAALLLKESPLNRFKAVKNAAELDGFRAAHRRDGVALVRFLRWLEETLEAGEVVTEIAIAGKLDIYRAAGERYHGPSFPSIVGYRENGAVVHYASTPETNKRIDGQGILLIDSGAHYMDGTTDVTRTLAIGEPTEEQRDRFTRVLKAHLSLVSQPFPEGCTDTRLDTLARTALWEAGLDFGHGVGHGVGSYLSVHEDPPYITFRKSPGAPLEAGMVLSIEPGYYEEGEYGVRHENLVAVREAPGLSRDGRAFLEFETLTLCPIDRTLIDRTLLTPDEIDGINAYHQAVLESLAPLLEARDARWLERAARPL